MQSNTDNGNSQINSTKDSYNSRVGKLYVLGGTKRIAWNSKRRHAAI